MFGISSPAYQTFFQSIIKALREDKELRLFEDEFRTPISGKTATQGLFLALEKVNGIIHLGGIERISRYKFGLMLMDVLGIHEARLLPCHQKDIIMAAPRSPDVSLDSSKAFCIRL